LICRCLKPLLSQSPRFMTLTVITLNLIYSSTSILFRICCTKHAWLSANINNLLLPVRTRYGKKLASSVHLTLIGRQEAITRLNTLQSDAQTLRQWRENGMPVSKTAEQRRAGLEKMRWSLRHIVSDYRLFAWSDPNMTRDVRLITSTLFTSLEQRGKVQLAHLSHPF
jgi:hypothetical protein